MRWKRTLTPSKPVLILMLGNNRKCFLKAAALYNIFMNAEHIEDYRYYCRGSIYQRQLCTLPHEFIERKPTCSHITWDGVVYSTLQRLIVIHGGADAPVRQPDAYGTSACAIRLPSVCGSWLVSVSWIFHDATAIPGYIPSSNYHLHTLCRILLRRTHTHAHASLIPRCLISSNGFLFVVCAAALFGFALCGYRDHKNNLCGGCLTVVCAEPSWIGPRS